ncbi:MAG: PolC-type DNA polymerase III [Clostridia bacterium]
MNKTELLRTLEETVPPLKGKLHIERVLYKKAANKAYMSFLSDALVGEKDYLALENRLRALFPKLAVALRIASPALGEDFLSDISKYKSVLIDFLRRQSPALSAWIGDTGWTLENGRILLTCPDSVAMNFFKTHKLDEKVSLAIYDIFRVRVPVALTICGERDAWVTKMRAERGFSFPARAAAPMDDDPPPWDDAAMNAQAAALFGQGSSPEKAPSYTAAKASPRPAKEAPAKGPVLKGRAIADKPVDIAELAEDSGIVVIEGTVTGVNETKELKGGETVLATFAVYDDTSTIYCKAFYQYRMKRAGMGETPNPPTDEEKKRVSDQTSQIVNGMRVRLRGDCRSDPFLGELSVSVRDMQQMPVRERHDLADEKRIELHMHTNMSTMDATAEAGSLIAQAAKWGHPAVAITDHGSAQAFPAAFGAAKKNNIKLIPGIEGYLCDLVPIVKDADDHPLNSAIVVLDFETTGLSAAMDRIIEVGAVKLVDGQIVDELSILCDPGVPLKPKIVDITGITDLMLRGKESPAEGVQKLLDFIGDCPVAAHNAPFDMGMLNAECDRMGISFHAPVLDTLTFARRLFPAQKSHRLGAVCRMLGVSLKNAHRAVHDAAATAQCLIKMYSLAAERGAKTLQDIDVMVAGESMSTTYHIILLCKTQKGMQNLNHLISDSNLRYFFRHPNMPRQLITQYREGLIIGSACEAGELYQAIVNGRPDSEIEKIAAFYDYLEIQPTGNNQFMLRSGAARDVEQLRDHNRRIVALGEKLGKPVVATGDVHFQNPEDAIYRTILQAGLGYDDCDEQPPLYFKTTDEMLTEFSYLGAKKAHEVVIDAPKLIADQVDELRLFPKHPKGEDTFQPFWEDAASDIENRSWGRAKALYGDPLPEVVEARLHKELGSIIGYGFATLYSIAQKLVSKSLSDGYLVGSRGSVGSSFVATMCGITEVNPLPPHYRCDTCHKLFFTPPELATVGVDLPDKCCDICGSQLVKDGFDIPFEVFLGFKGDKVPDIDLNFSGEYQPRAHAYIEELFGKGFVFRAGTISGLADKTAFGFAAKYLEMHGIKAGRAHKERLAAGCVGVKRTTGQHPGGIVVLPKEYDICQFTAIQHPADDISGTTLTTHFDFNSMHDILVKLDCLGHDDPTMMHRLEELTKVNFLNIPLDDKKVMSLFTSPEALGVTPAQIMCQTGTLGIPEFGTAFVQGMLLDTKPTTMEELIRISGLSHGTDVWLGNAKDLIDNGTAVLKECICTRDDIMNYLIAKGVPSKISFDTMESVRKGRGLKPEMEAAMNEHNVPAWFIDSCKKIKYMFPKGHAVAYVTMGLRVAWYKVYLPQAYYAAYFSIRGDGFDAGRMLLSNETLRDRLNEFAQREEKLSVKDKQEENAYHMILEMQERGIQMLPVDLYRSDATRFLPEGDNLRCPFTSINGFGESAVTGIIETRDPSKPYISVEDFRTKAHVGASIVEMLRAQGAFEGMPESSQMDLFSLMA